MVVADGDPPRKRSRLSLKSRKGGDIIPPADDSDDPPTLESAGTVPQGPVLLSEHELSEGPPPVLDLAESDLPTDGPGVPPVAAMENLGNTCFLNSVLEVLRYTPCFLEGLEELYRHIVYLEKIKSSNTVQNSEEVKKDASLSWDLVKNLFKMYKRMEKREEMFSHFASAEVTNMSVKPDKILDVIREFNPMFEGNMQHDAQELLRCLLSYLEDAERELHTDYTSILVLDPSLLKTPGLESERQNGNQSVEKTPQAGKRKAQHTKSAIANLKFDQPITSTNSDTVTEKQALRLKMDCDLAHLKSPNPFSSLDDLLANDFVYDTKADSSSNFLSDCKNAAVNGTTLQTHPIFETLDESDGMVMKFSLADSPVSSLTEANQEGIKKSKPVTLNTRRSARRTAVNGRLGDINKVFADLKRQSRVPQLNCNSKLDLNLNPLVQSDKPVLNGESSRHEELTYVDKSQPTILSMFGPKNKLCRRLGMRGRVLRDDSNPNLSETVEFSDSVHESRKSPLKSRNLRPLAMTDSPLRQDTFMRSPTSPARPDEFPALAVNGDSITFDADSCEFIHKSASDQAWNVTSLESTQTCIDSSKYSASVVPTHFSAAIDLKENVDLNELPDLVQTENTPSPDGLNLVSASAVNSSPMKVEHTNAYKLPSNRLNDCPSKLMIRLQKCDQFCNSPTVSASAFMKALKEPSPANKKVNSGINMEEPISTEQDSDEDEVSLGTKSSFKSVPLKSVCVKVEKCDMVCNSPAKSVSARFATTCMARQRAQRFNMVEKLFQGTMMMKTKCLECERCTERKESFQDVSVPLKAEGSIESESETDDEKNSCLLHLMHAFTDVEHLRDDNKYFCEQCFRYVEAERSLHYETLPNILTVHLKRFSATGMFGCLSKINDHVTVPLLLACLRYKCPKPCMRPDHRYTLFAIITHAGSTISAGHYLSYIKVRPNAVGCDTLSSYLRSSEQKKNHFFPSVLTSESQEAIKSSSDQQDSWPYKTDGVPGCEPPLGRQPSNCVSGKGDACTALACLDEDFSQTSDWKVAEETVYSGGDVADCSERDLDSNPMDYHWLECDDERIRILTEKEFHGRLLEKEGSLRGTPYVLFYHRLDTWRTK